MSFDGEFFSIMFFSYVIDLSQEYSDFSFHRSLKRRRVEFSAYEKSRAEQAPTMILMAFGMTSLSVDARLARILVYISASQSSVEKIFDGPFANPTGFAVEHSSWEKNKVCQQ